MWKYTRKFTLVLFFIFFSYSAWSYGLLRSSYGSIVQWSGNNPNQKIYLTPANSHGISEEDIKNAFSESIAQWNSLGNIEASFVVVNDRDTASRESRNDAYFSDNSIFFSGAGVLAVTQITFRERDGFILESDIIFKDVTRSDNFFNGVDFVMTQNDFNNPYIGSVMAHELGHFLGLGHSQVMEATMFYVNRRGQHRVIEDDRAGIQELYGKNGNWGSIFGNVVGGKPGNTVGIFGSHVKVISMKKGRVVAGGYGNSDGSFSIPGLDLDDTYYLYVEPIKNLEAAPRYYSTAKRDFCNNRSSYEGSFFQSCNSSEKGYPQGVALSTAQAGGNVGSVTIGCGLDTPADYSQSKDGDTFDIPVVNGNLLGNTFVGSFDGSEVDNRTPDTININLEDVDISSNDYYLELKVVFQSFYSKLKMDMRVESETYDNTFTATTDNYDNPILDIVARIPLDTDSSENNFDLTLTPQKFSTYLATTDYGLNGEGAYYPNSSSFQENRVFYFFIANIARKTDANEYVPESFRQYALSDNTECLDGKFSYAVLGNVRSETDISRALRSISEDNDRQSAVSCGTVDIQGGNGGGGNPLGIVVGFLLGLLLLRRPRIA